jgi:hypothetical protein
MARRRRRAHNWRSKGSTTARGYGWTHQAERKRWEPIVESGYAVCVRCGLPIIPGTPFHLDHRDDQVGYLGVAHARCNLKAAAERGNALMREKYAQSDTQGRVASRDW